MERIRVGVAGSGFMGRTHVDAARRLDSTEVVAVAGGTRAAKLAQDYGIEFESDVEALIARDDLDAIIIATPHHRHCDEAIQAAETGKHVLVEKPMATSLDDCDRMTAACQAAGRVLSVGYHQRFRESNIKTRELIRQGAIGSVRCIQTSALFDIDTMRHDSGFGGNWSWWKDPRSVAHLINSAPHTIDLCRWWLDSNLATVAAHSGTFREDNPNENTTMSLLSFANGAMCAFWSSSVLPEPGFEGSAFRFRFMGDDGIIDLDPYDRLRIARDGAWKTVFAQPPVEFDDSDAAFNMGRMQAYCDQVQAFVDTIHGQPSKEGNAADGRAGVAAVLAMLESSENQQTIHING